MSETPVRHCWTESGRFVPRTVVQPLQRILGHTVAGAALMGLGAMLALVSANSQFADSYAAFWHTELSVVVGDYTSLADMDLRHWLNDGLMTLFFLLVSLEIKRELVSGHLQNKRTALVPVLAAAGGMLVPAAIYLAVNTGGPGARGWGIPMATDIVFAVAVLTLFGKRVNPQLRIFLLTLAVVDDLGAILVIAVFYNTGIAHEWLVLACAAVVAAWLMQRLHVRSLGAYCLLGTVCWVALFETGVHPTIAGVAFGLLTPAWSFYDPSNFASRARGLVDVFDQAYRDGVLTQSENTSTQSALRDMKRLASETESPLGRAELRLAPWVTLGIVPLFALANAGITIETELVTAALDRPIILGVLLGLVLGKPLGILAVLVAVHHLGLWRLPRGSTWLEATGVATAAGIGFTVALFVADLAFQDVASAGDAKAGILIGSAVACLLSLLLLSAGTRRRRMVSGVPSRELGADDMSQAPQLLHQSR